MKILYAGSPKASAMVLTKLIESQKDAGFEIAGVLTNPPSTRGRHKDLVPTEVASAARNAGIPVFEFDHLMADAREAISPLGADLLVSFDYGRIFGPKFLGLFTLGGINLHPSALPKYRGCTPVPAAILAGDKKLGVTVQKLALKTDEGDILAQDFIELTGNETTESLMDGDSPDTTPGADSPVTKLGSELLLSVLSDAAKKLAAGAEKSPAVLGGTPQAGDSSYTPFIKKEDGNINWNETAEEIDRKIRAYTPWPMCSTMWNGQKLTIVKAKVGAGSPKENAAPGEKSAASLEAKLCLDNSAVPVTAPGVNSGVNPGTVLPYNKAAGIEIACGNGTVLVATELQLQGKKAMDYKSFLNGARNFIGAVLG